MCLSVPHPQQERHFGAKSLGQELAISQRGSNDQNQRRLLTSRKPKGEGAVNSGSLFYILRTQVTIKDDKLVSEKFPGGKIRNTF